MGLLRGVEVMPLSNVNCWVTNECDAPKSNKIVVGAELTRNVPSTTFGSS
mgnify:CR=1 FL=1